MLGGKTRSPPPRVCSHRPTFGPTFESPRVESVACSVSRNRAHDTTRPLAGKLNRTLGEETKMTDNTGTGRFLKTGMLKKPALATLRGVPTRGRFEGKYDLPLSIKEQPFTLSVSAKNPQWSALIGAFGEPAPSWVGATVQVSEDDTFEQMNVVPIADAKGHPAK